jgi:hypothetical protein
MRICHHGRPGRAFGTFGRSSSLDDQFPGGLYMERFGDAMTGGIGPTRNLSNTRMTEQIKTTTVVDLRELTMIGASG